MSQARILFCNCTYAQVVPAEVKEAVLRRLCESETAFDAVADICELSARRDASLRSLARDGNVKIAACFPRAVKWLFAGASAPLRIDTTEVVNMRTLTADEVIARLQAEGILPNLPAGKVTAADAPTAPAAAETIPAP